MTIMASAPVPPSSRLIDADTTDLAATPRPRPTGDDRYAEGYADGLQRALTARPAVPAAEPGSLAARVFHLTHDRIVAGDPAPTLPEMADALGVTDGQILDAIRHLITAATGIDPAVPVLPRQRDARFSVMNTAARADVELVELVELAAQRNPEGVRALADSIRARQTVCPPWCSKDHRGQTTEVVEGFTIGLVHERLTGELTGIDPATTSDPATAAVLVESTTEGGDVVEPARVVLTVAEGTEGAYAGGQDVQGWTGTPEQAEALAAALLDAARTVRAGLGAAYRVDVYDADDVLLASREVTAADDRAALDAAGGLVDDLGGAVLAAVFTTGATGALVFVGTSF